LLYLLAVRKKKPSQLLLLPLLLLQLLTLSQLMALLLLPLLLLQHLLLQRRSNFSAVMKKALV
jgi:inner membrane protein involved in colicin E2 resistance